MTREPGDLPHAVVLFSAGWAETAEHRCDDTGLRSSSRFRSSRPKQHHRRLHDIAWIFQEMQSMRTRTALSFVAALGAMSATAAAATADPESLQQVVVVATRLPTPADQIASSVTVITAEEIEASQQRTLVDVLKNVPGLNLVQAGGPGDQTSVFMRGTNSNHTKILIDGIDLSDPSNANGAFDFGQLLTTDIERIEVLRGPQSGLYGSDAIGGVINIITKSGQGPAHGGVGLEGGSFSTFNQAASLGGSADSLHYSADLGHFHAGSTPVTPLDLLAPGEARINDYYDNLTASGKLGYDFSRDFDVGLVARYTGTHLRNTGEDYSTFPAFPDAEQSDSNITAYHVRGTAHLVLGDGFFEQTLGLTYSHNKTEYIAPQTAPAFNVGERTKADWLGALKFSAAQTLVLGAEYARDEISDPLAASMSTRAGFAELQSKLGDSFYSALNVRYDDNDRFGSKATFRVAPTYTLAATQTQLKASVGTGFKAPTLSQLFQSFPPFFFANPDLKPETSTGWDAGFEQGFAGNTVRLGATYYHNDIKNLIGSDATFTTWANVGRATTEGVESFLAYRPLKGLALRVDYTFTQAKDATTGQELLRRPKHKGSVDASWQVTDPFSLDLTVLTVGSWVDGNRDFSVSPLEAPGYTTVNLAGNYDLGPRVAVFARMTNMLDRHYQNPTGFLAPGFGAFAGVKVAF
ncbi:MAG: TonB-dependent receptor [Proteobacteria bacterium]|nr:TonB-dependent receptor [Pseudomonadota bacterium]